MIIEKTALPDVFTGDRNISTSIYYLLEQGDFSAFHRIKSDELWHFYDGDRLEIVELNTGGEVKKHYLGLDDNCFPQVVIPAGSWFAARPLGKYTLVGCTVSPGFDFADFEMADKTTLLRQYPRHKDMIVKFFR